MHIYICLYMYIYMHIHMCIYMYIYIENIYIYLYKNIYIHIHTYMYLPKQIGHGPPGVVIWDPKYPGSNIWGPGSDKFVHFFSYGTMTLSIISQGTYI
jgi:hypothetical protein